MSGEPTPGETAAPTALRATALATKKQADDAAAALLAADPNADPLPPAGPPPAVPMAGIDLATLESLMSRATCIQKSTEGLRMGISV